MLAALFAGFGLARPDPQSLPDRAIIEQFGDGQLLELRPNPDGSPKSYTIYALSRPAGMGRMMQPLDANREVVNTASQPVELRPGQTRTITQYYRNQAVAYLRVDFSMAGITHGDLSHNGQPVVTLREHVQTHNALWGILWAATSGLISLFWIPVGTASATYNTVIPLDGRTHEVFFHGGGGCFAFQPDRHTLTFNANQMQAGGIYHVHIHINCRGIPDGIRGVTWLHLRPLQVAVDPPAPGASAVNTVARHLHFNTAGGGEIWSNNSFQMDRVDVRYSLLDTGRPVEVVNHWETRQETRTRTEEEWVCRYEQVPVCREVCGEVCEVVCTEDGFCEEVCRNECRQECHYEERRVCRLEPVQVNYEVTVYSNQPLPVGTVVSSTDNNGNTVRYRYQTRSHPGYFQIDLNQRRTLSGTVEQRPVTRTDAYGRQVTVQELVIHPNPVWETIHVVNRWERVP
jgi:hypothetical protein